jgi:C-terminal processing protease CtpA/Prc
MRGYPHGTAWSISPHLTDKKEVFAANFRRYSPMGIQEGNTSHVTEFDQAIPPPQLPYYRGMTVMLIDENTQSQAEHTGLFFRAANGNRFIGSQTAGANGDVTNFEIPGNIILYFSGHDVRHADGTQLQKVGLVPDIHVKPTIAGFRAGKDEVLDAAIEYLTREINK